MGSAGRTVPPTADRLAAAARGGSFARSRLLTGGAVMLAAGLALRLDGPRVFEGIATLVRDGIGAAVRERPDPGAALQQAVFRGLELFGPLLVAVAAIALIVVSIPALIARRGRGATAVPLPEEPRFRPGRTALGVVTAASIVLLALALFGEAGPLLRGLTRGTSGAAGAIIDLAAGGVAGVGAVLVLAGLADLALERTRLLRALALTRSEQRLEWRTHGGDVDVRRQVRQLARPERDR